LTPELAQSLGQAAAMAADSLDPWWIIGSTAVVLHGGDVGKVKDVDLMMSAGDAERFLRRAGVRARGGESSDRFRSRVFGTWAGTPVPVEVFGGFEVVTNDGWRPVALTTREALSVGQSDLFVPSAQELVRLLKMFGRPKDLERARLLQL